MSKDQKMIGLPPDVFNELMGFIQDQPLKISMGIWDKINKSAQEISVQLPEPKKEEVE